MIRVYLPVDWAQARRLAAEAQLPGPLRGCAVDPAWRAGAPDVDEEQWEYEAAEQAAAGLPAGGGVVLAVDVDALPGGIDDGWVELAGPVHRRDLGAVLDADLGWYAVQELGALLEDAP